MGHFFKPTQARTKYTQVDPMIHVKPQQQYVENVLRGQFGQGGAGTFNPYAPPLAEQMAALGQLGAMQQYATPAFGTGLQTTERTVGGGYLDPMAQAGFRNVAEGQESLSNALFGQMLAHPSTAIDPRFAAPVLDAQRARALQRMQTMTEADIAGAGLEQYGAERAAQQAAMLRGAQFAPSMAGRIFGAGEKLRAGQQQAASAQLSAQMRARGYDQQAIQNLIQYLHLGSGRTLRPMTGKSPYESTLSTAMNVSKLAACWIAMELYGEHSVKVHLARYAIFVLWKGRLARWAQRLYLRHGQAVARAIRVRPWLRRAITPLFDFAVAKGQAALGLEA
jgi:hypothetical protein